MLATCKRQETVFNGMRLIFQFEDANLQIYVLKKKKVVIWIFKHWIKWSYFTISSSLLHHSTLISRNKNTRGAIIIQCCQWYTTQREIFFTLHQGITGISKTKSSIQQFSSSLGNWIKTLQHQKHIRVIGRGGGCEGKVKEFE